MNKLYDHLELMAKLDADQFKVFNICSINSTYFATMIYNYICQSRAVNPQVFRRDWFLEWINSNIMGGEVTHLESEVLIWISKYPGFIDFYKGDWSIDSVINSVLQSWKNKPKTLRMDKFGMLYDGFMRFIQSNKGQNFLYGTTADDLIEDIPAQPDIPFYEQAAYKFEQANKCKKEVILEIAKNGTEVVEAAALWDTIFYSDKFNVAKAISIAQEDPRLKDRSSMQIRRDVNALMVRLLRALLKGDRLETYFDADCVLSLDGANYTLRSALEYYLITTEADAEEVKKKPLKEQKKIINGRVNLKAYTKDELREVIVHWAKSKNIPCSFYTGYYKSIAKLKIDSLMKAHKQYKIWIYEGGGYRDFYSDSTGSLADLIPREFFEGV